MVPVSPPSSMVLCHFSTIAKRQCYELKPFPNLQSNLDNIVWEHG